MKPTIITNKALRSSSQKPCLNNRELSFTQNLKAAEVVGQGNKWQDILNKLKELDSNWIFLTILSNLKTDLYKKNLQGKSAFLMYLQQ